MQANVCGKEKMNLEEKNQKNESCCGSTKLVKGVVCDVHNCAYHNGKSECHAGCISVGPYEADCSASTACATFKPREY